MKKCLNKVSSFIWLSEREKESKASQRGYKRELFVM